MSYCSIGKREYTFKVFSKERAKETASTQRQVSHSNVCQMMEADELDVNIHWGSKGLIQWLKFDVKQLETPQNSFYKIQDSTNRICLFSET